MAKASTATKPKRTRASPELQAEIAARLSNGESAEILAGEYGKSFITIRGYGKDADPAKPSPRSSAKATQQTSNPSLRNRLLNYAVMHLTGEPVDQAEIDDLKQAIKDGMRKDFIKGL